MDKLTYSFKAQPAKDSANAQQLVEAISSFDGQQQVPLVSGVPKVDDPALGWLVSINLADGEVSGVISVVDEETLNLIEARTDKRIAIAVFPPNSTSNPTPGKPALRYVSVIMEGAEFADLDGCVAFACDPAPAVQFAAPAGFDAEPDQLSHWQRAQAYAASRGVSMIEAAIATEDQTNN